MVVPKSHGIVVVIQGIWVRGPEGEQVDDHQPAISGSHGPALAPLDRRVIGFGVGCAWV
jgi:hypothetical protein